MKLIVSAIAASIFSFVASPAVAQHIPEENCLEDDVFVEPGYCLYETEPAGLGITTLTHDGYSIAISFVFREYDTHYYLSMRDPNIGEQILKMYRLNTDRIQYLEGTPQDFSQFENEILNTINVLDEYSQSIINRRR